MLLVLVLARAFKKAWCNRSRRIPLLVLYYVDMSAFFREIFERSERFSERSERLCEKTERPEMRALKNYECGTNEEIWQRARSLHHQKSLNYQRIGAYQARLEHDDR